MPMAIESFVAAPSMYRRSVTDLTVAFEGNPVTGNPTIDRVHTFAPQNPTTRFGLPPKLVSAWLAQRKLSETSDGAFGSSTVWSGPGMDVSAIKTSPGWLTRSRLTCFSPRPKSPASLSFREPENHGSDAP